MAGKSEMKSLINLHKKSSKNAQYIIELNNLLKQKKIKLLLIQLPMSKYYLEYLPPKLMERNQ